jgi:hypothetical protein
VIESWRDVCAPKYQTYIWKEGCQSFGIPSRSRTRKTIDRTDYLVPLARCVLITTLSYGLIWMTCRTSKGRGEVWCRLASHNTHTHVYPCSRSTGPKCSCARSIFLGHACREDHRPRTHTHSKEVESCLDEVHEGSTFPTSVTSSWKKYGARMEMRMTRGNWKWAVTR